MNIIFLDFDGPMIPGRMHIATKAGLMPDIHAKFDPVAVKILEMIIYQSETKYVISSSWKTTGKEFIISMFRENDMSPYHLHEDWCTPSKLSSTRSQEILMWLDEHPNINKYAVIDDELLDGNLENIIRVSYEDGLQFFHYAELLQIFDVKPKTHIF